MIDSINTTEKAVRDTVYLALDPRMIESFSKSDEWTIALVSGIIAIIAGLLPQLIAILEKYYRKKTYIESINKELIYNWHVLNNHLKRLKEAIEEIQDPKLRVLSKNRLVVDFPLWNAISKEKHLEVLGDRFYEYDRTITYIKEFKALSAFTLYEKVKKNIQTRLTNESDLLDTSDIIWQEIYLIQSVIGQIIEIRNSILSIDFKLLKDLPIDYDFS
jgi:uncharacterized protein YlzI (FlbEa/FlbD family)